MFNIIMSIISEYIIIDDHVESEMEKLIWASIKLKILSDENQALFYEIRGLNI